MWPLSVVSVDPSTNDFECLITGFEPRGHFITLFRVISAHARYNSAGPNCIGQERILVT
jgi:hypothetical protein